MSKNKSDTAVAVISETSSMGEIVAHLDKQYAAIKKITTTAYKGPKVVGGIDIQSCRDVRVLLHLLATAQLSEKVYNEAAASIDLSTYPTYQTQEGATVEQISHDIKLSIKIAQIDKQIKRYQALKKEAEDLMDKEDKKALLLKKLTSLDTSDED